MSVNGHAPRNWVTAALRRYEGPLVQYAQRITGDFERARDAVQETFLKLCQESRAEVNGHLAQWLYTVCRNQAIDQRRKESRMTTLAEPGILDADHRQPEPWQTVADEECTTLILVELERLPANQQECIRLKLQHGLTYREISGVTDLSMSNVGFLIHAGLKTIRERMQRRDRRDES
ncbi:MAG: RNA polymerase sigma factor [Planctomycetaceae bacterium]